MYVKSIIIEAMQIEFQKSITVITTGYIYRKN